MKMTEIGRFESITRSHNWRIQHLMELRTKKISSCLKLFYTIYKK
jgi:hypothetical protein